MSVRDAIAEILGITPQRGDEWTILCPAPEHTDHRPSASIYVGEPMDRLRGGRTVKRLPGMWTCYSCHRSGRVSNEAIETYEPTFDRNLQVALEQLESHERRTFPESWLALFDYPGGIHPYWLARFTDPTCRKHRLGYDFERNAGTYPLRDPAGAVLGVVHRSFDVDATGWKYRYPPGVDKSSLLYGYAEAVRADAPYVVLVEGALDAVACDEAGSQALAILGSRISPEQVRLVNRLYPRTIVLAFDNDAAGRHAAEHALDPSTGLTCTDIVTVTLGDYNDIAEVPLAERAEVIARALDS